MKASLPFLISLSTIFFAGFGLLTDALYRIQIQEVASFKEDLADQSTRRVRVPGRRGRILDRHGTILAETRAAHDIVCYPEAFHGKTVSAKITCAAERLADATGIKCIVNQEKVETHLRGKSARPIVIAQDVNMRDLARFEELADGFPEFGTIVRPERTYPFHSLAAHLLGYVGRDRPLSGASTVVHYYEPDMRGRSGLEAYYDSFLAGAPGDLRLIVNARGFTTDTIVERAAVPGPDLILTLDARLQHTVEKELVGVCGACVILDPRNGAVLALASAPTYDPNAFVPFITESAYHELTENSARPLINRAISGLFAPGSTFKPITAIAALNHGWEAADALECSGIYRGTRCIARWGHGPLQLREAIEKSCNPFFLQLGQLVGGENILAVARSAGLGNRTGIDLHGEAAGQLSPWHFQSAMGQGALLVTPLQLAVACAAIANGGKVFRPYLHNTDPADIEPISTIETKPEYLRIVRQGMRDVVTYGSACKAFSQNHNGHTYTLAVPAAGKTGSAEVGSHEKRWKNTWFVAFAPYDAPTVAIAMLIERGEFGGSTVAPRVYRVLESIFGSKEIEG